MLKIQHGDSKLKKIHFISDIRKLYNLINSKQKKQLLRILFIMIIGAIFEMLSIGLILPAFSLLNNPEQLANFGFTSTLNFSSLVVLFCLIFFLLFLTKNMFLIFMFWKQSKFTYSMLEHMSKKLFIGYLYRPFTFHLQHNSSELIKNIIGEVNVFTGVIKASMLFATEIIVMFFLLILLMYVDFMSALISILILGIFGFLFNRYTAKYTKKWGKARQFHDGYRIQHVQQGLGANKEIKLGGLEKEFGQKFIFHNLASAEIGQKQNFLENTPRLWIEILVVLIFSGLTITLVLSNKDMEAIIAILIVFALSAFRLMPSISRIVTSIQRLNYSMPVIEMIDREFNENNKIQKISNDNLSNVDDEIFKNWSLISLNNLTYGYHNSEKKVFKKLSFSIKRNTSIGIIGESGSGKSTLINILLGLLPIEKGDYLIDSYNVNKNLSNWQKKIGYVPQSIFLIDDTLKNNIAFGIPEKDIDPKKIKTALRLSHLEKFVDGFVEKENVLVGENGARISGGQRQRIGIARALYHDPEILIMDEATSALNFEIESEIMKDIYALNGKKTIIVVTHRLTALSHCDNIYKMEGHNLLKQNILNGIIK